MHALMSLEKQLRGESLEWKKAQTHCFNFSLIHLCEPPTECLCFSNHFSNHNIFRSTPVEVLHSILLGPYKYLLKTLISRLSADQKCQILAKMQAFNYSGRVIGNLIAHHKSFVGRDYKAFAQMALHIIWFYLDDGERRIWLNLSKVSYSILTVWSV